MIIYAEKVFWFKHLGSTFNPIDIAGSEILEAYSGSEIVIHWIEPSMSTNRSHHDNTFYGLYIEPYSR